MPLHLRDVVDSDYTFFFDLQRDDEGAKMAAFGTRDADARALAVRWRRGTSTTKAIVLDASVVGYVSSFTLGDELHLTYWIARSHWGRGVATAAVEQFLRVMTERPLHASTAHDNVGSQRVLEKCGFVKTGTERAFASARGEEIDEVFFVLE